MDVIEAIHTRRSIRAYSVRPVERELIEQVIWDAAQAPPPRRGQMPWTFNVIQGGERIAEFGCEAKQYAKEMISDERSRIIAGTLLGPDQPTRRIISGRQLHHWVAE